MKSVFYLVVIFFLFSCTDPVSEDTSSTTGLGFCESGACVVMDMSDDLELIISIVNFQQTISVLSFELFFDNSDLEISTASGETFGEIDFQSLEATDTTVASFSFLGTIVGDGSLMKVNFKKQGSNYNGTMISIGNLQMIDADGNEIEYTPFEDLWIEQTCYIDEGILIYVASSPAGPIGEGWEPTNNYVWSTTFCHLR